MERPEIAPGMPPLAVHHVNHVNITELAGDERQDGPKIERLGRTEMLLQFGYVADGRLVGAPIVIVMSAAAYLNFVQAVFTSSARLQAGPGGASAPQATQEAQ